MDKKIIAIIIVSLLVGGCVGYMIGFTSGLSWCFDKALWMLDHQGIKIEFNKAMIMTGLMQYKNNIGGCMFTENLTANNTIG
jgi:hypothetical protein